MTRISAAGNIIIHAEPDRWQMLVNTDFVDQVQGDGVLLEARAGEPLRYTTAFARSRRLPKSGSLATRYIQRVVLGWSWEDEAWHLGFLFEPALADARGSRWCELVKWPDPERDVFREMAVECGQVLAQHVGRPFNIIPVQERVVKEKTMQRPLPSLPVQLQGWLFERQNNGWFAFVRDRSWARERVRSVFQYLFWIIVYLVLAIGTLVSDIALPRPEFLPYLGLATAVLLLGIVVYRVYELRRKPRRIVVDPQTRQIWGAPANDADKPLWRMGRENIDSVYVSQVVKYQKQKPIVQYGEINLRLTTGDYYHLLNQEDLVPLDEDLRLNGSAGIMPLATNDVQTDLQAAGAYIAKALNVPVWYDHRGK